RSRECPDAEQIAARFFPAAEAEELRGEPADRRSLSFLTRWTRKEAYVKATGQGLSGLTDSAQDGWWIRELDAPPGFAAAVAVSGESCELRCFPFAGADEFVAGLGPSFEPAGAGLSSPSAHSTFRPR